MPIVIVGTINLSGCNFQIAYDLISQSTTNNTSTLSIYGILNVTNSYVAWSSGQAWTHNNRVGLATRYNQDSYVLTQGNYTFPHDANGNCNVSVGYGLSSTYTSGSSTATWSLPKINRVAITDSVEGNNVEETFKINYTKYIDSYTYKLRVSIPNVVELEKVDYNTSGADYQLSNTALQTLYSRMTSNSINLGFAVETWQGSTFISNGNEKVVKCYLTNANPITRASGYQFEDVATTLDGSSITTLTGSTLNNVRVVDGYTNLKLTIPVASKSTAQKGASMVSYRLTDENSKSIEIAYSDTENVYGTLQNTSGSSFDVASIDSRGNSTTPKAVFGYDSVKYSKTLLNKSSCTLQRDDGQVGENAILTLDGEFFNNNFGVQNNVLNISYRLKKTDSDTWITGRTTITPTLSDNSFTYTGAIASDNSNGKWDLDSSYNVEITASDYLSSDTISFILNSAIPTLSLDKNGVGIMCAYDSSKGGLLQVGGNNILLEGTILYENSSGTTGTVSLSDTYTNYKLIEVFGKKDNIVSSTKFDTTLNNKASLTISNKNNSSTITIYTNTSTFSGTRATVVGGAVAFNSSGVVGFTGSNEIYIIKVVGYKNN